MGALIQDVRYAVRGLVRSPGFALIAILTLALGIGANTAIFSVVNAVLLHPLPYPEPDRLVRVFQNETKSRAPRSSVSAHNFTDWAERTRSFDGMAAYRYGTAVLTGGDDPVSLPSVAVTAGFFKVSGIAPLLGRSFLPEDDRSGAPGVALLSHGLWQRRFAADPSIVGRQLVLDGAPVTVVGVMPEGFTLPGGGVQLWTPLALDLSKERRDHGYLSVIGRLGRGLETAGAIAEMSGVAARLEREHPAENAGVGATIVPLQELIVGNFRPALLMLFGAVGLVLLITCANVASLLLARAAGRRREVAIRVALGAGRLRLVRQFLTESLLLSLLGGGLSLVLAFWAADFVRTVNPGGLPRASEIGVNGSVFAFMLAVSLLTGWIFGLVPALHASSLDVGESLKQNARTGGTSRRAAASRSALVVAEVALAVVLFISAGLLTKSLLRLQQVEPGFDPASVLTAQVSLPALRYGDDAKRTAFVKEALRRLKALPGVRAAGATSEIPVGDSTTTASFKLDAGETLPGDALEADLRFVTPGYFQAMSIPLLRGRSFSDEDPAPGRGAVVINERMARWLWPQGDALGERILDLAPDDQPLEIVGVVGDVRHGGLDQEAPAEMYLPYGAQATPTLFLAVGTSGDPAGLAAALRSAVREVDHDLPVRNVATMEQRLSGSLAPRRFNAVLLSIFSVVALVLSLIGVYGVVSYSVAQRTREIGIRLALGARGADVVRLIGGEGLRLALAGAALGLVAAFGLSRLMTSLLFGVSPSDPLTFAGAALIFTATALVAAWVPSRRVLRVDPIITLRSE
ncbi:MAG: ABC transporter permease [Acidobacteria bacterium]|nr:ABC transporter permease [Acidobacteriota bacterium]